jgi:hypothetical protein
VGCSFSKDSTNNARKRELEEQEKADTDYRKVTGTYAGQLNLGNNKYDIELKLFTLTSAPSKDPATGRDILVTELRADYTKIRPAGTGFSFKAQFYPETGKLLLANTEKEETLGPDDIHTIELNLVYVMKDGVSIRQLQGMAKGLRGPIGQFENLVLVTNQSDVGDGTEQERENARLKKEYDKIAGTYYGNVMGNSPDSDPLAVKLRIYVYTDTINTKAPPILKALFEQQDGSDLQFDLQTLYQPELRKPKLSMSGKPLRAPNTNLTANISGYFEADGTYHGHVQYSSLYVDGDFVLSK